VSGLWELARFERGTEVRMAGDTLPQLFRNAARARAGKVWMREKKLGIWREWRWDEAATVVREIAMGLAAIDLQPGQTASILSNTVVEWVLADLGVLCAGGVSNGIYPTDSASQVAYLCADSATRVIFVEDEEQLDKVLEVRAQLPPNTPLDAARVAVTSRWFVISGRLRLDERVLEERSLVERRDADVVVRRRERINLSEPR